jgi:hypothetical protein
MTPGPIERRWTSRLHYKVFGRWPQSVVGERLSRPWTPPEYFKAVFREMYEREGIPVPPEYR